MNEEIKLELKAVKKVITRLESSYKEYTKKHEERAAALKKLIDEYATAEEAQDAYGWGFITEDQYDLIREAFSEQDKAMDAPTEFSVSAKIIGSFIKELKDSARFMEYELMTPEQKLKHDENVEAHRRQLEEIKTRRGLN